MALSFSFSRETDASQSLFWEKINGIFIYSVAEMCESAIGLGYVYGKSKTCEDYTIHVAVSMPNCPFYLHKLARVKKGYVRGYTGFSI
jgi:hypothetical protein